MYLSRQVGAGAWQVETLDDRQRGHDLERPRRSRRTGKNVRPVSPRGMAAFGGDLSVIWMNGGYPSYVDYDTAIHAFMPAAANAPPSPTPSRPSGAGPRRSR